MSKKRPVVIDYANRRILLETIASYWPWTKPSTADETRHGIEYLTRGGELVDASGNDKLSRDKAIEFLDRYFKPDKFPGQKCAVCAKRSKDCSSKYTCYSYNNHKGFKRKEEDEPSSENVHSEAS